MWNCYDVHIHSDQAIMARNSPFVCSWGKVTLKVFWVKKMCTKNQEFRQCDLVWWWTSLWCSTMLSSACYIMTPWSLFIMQFLLQISFLCKKYTHFSIIHYWGMLTYGRTDWNLHYLGEYILSSEVIMLGRPCEALNT